MANIESNVEFPNQLPVPPIDMVMPETPNLVFTVLNFVVLGIVAAMLLRSSFRQWTPIPILFLVGGMLAYVTEPFFDMMVGAWYPQHGTDSFLRAFNVRVPVWVIGPWGFYIGGQAYLVYMKFFHGMRSDWLWKMFPIFWITNVMFEIPGLQLGVYTYYGPQAFKIGGFPLWMGVANACMPILIGAVVYSIRSFLTGPRAWLLVPMMPMLAVASGGTIGWPMWFALNSGFTETGTMIVTGVVVAQACLMITIVNHFLAKDKAVAIS